MDNELKKEQRTIEILENPKSEIEQQLKFELDVNEQKSTTESANICASKDLDMYFQKCWELMSNTNALNSDSDMDTNDNLTLTDSQDVNSPSEDAFKFDVLNNLRTDVRNYKLRNAARSRFRGARRRIIKFYTREPKDLNDLEKQRFIIACKIVQSTELKELIKSKQNSYCPNELQSKDCSNVKALVPVKICEMKLEENTQTKSTQIVDKPQENSLPDDIVVAVININDAESKFVFHQWKFIEQKIQNALIENFSSGSMEEIQFDGTRWEKWYKIVTCTNKLSKDFLINTLCKLDGTWDGVQLRAIPRADIVLYQRPKAWIWIPKPYQSSERVLTLLRAQNKELMAEEWRVINKEPKQANGQHFLLRLSRKSLPYLKKHRGQVRFSLSKVQVKLISNSGTADDVGEFVKPALQQS